MDSAGSKVNRVGWLECDGAEAFRSRRRCWLELLSSAGEERGPCGAEEMFRRESVNREHELCEGTGKGRRPSPGPGGRRTRGCEGQRRRPRSGSVLSACPPAALPYCPLLAQDLRADPGAAGRPLSPGHHLPRSGRRGCSGSRPWGEASLGQGNATASPLSGGSWGIASLKATLALLNEALLPEDSHSKGTGPCHRTA